MKEGLSFLSNSHVPLLLPPNKSLSIFHSKAAPNKYGRIKAEMEVRVCINRTCKRQGSIQTLEILSGIAPPDVSVKSCGCLSRCGAGPNLVILPGAVFVGHCGTAAQAAEFMATLCGGGSLDASKSLDALSLRKRAEDELSKGNFSEAELLLSKAIDLKPHGGIHIIYKHSILRGCLANLKTWPAEDKSAWFLFSTVWSSAKLAVGNYSGALEDATESLTLAPRYSEAYLCQGDAFLAMNQFDAAEKSYSTSLELDPSIRRSKSFKARITKLQEKFAAANML